MKITCQRVTELAYEYVGGELTTEITEHVRVHLGECPNCVTLINSYRVTVQVARQLPAKPMPATLEARLAEALKKMQDEV